MTNSQIMRYCVLHLPSRWRRIHQANPLWLFFWFRKETLPVATWALTDSTEHGCLLVSVETSRHPFKAFQAASQIGCAWIVVVTCPATKHYDRLRKECNAGLSAMDRSVFIATILICLARTHSIFMEQILNLVPTYSSLPFQTAWRGTTCEWQRHTSVDLSYRQLMQNDTCLAGQTGIVLHQGEQPSVFPRRVRLRLCLVLSKPAQPGQY